VSGRRGLLLGIALVVAANALLLAGVSRNRSREEARLALSERELSIAPQAIGDDTSRSLRLGFETDHTEDAGSAAARLGFQPDWMDERAVPWLDRAKLAALGFDVRLDPADPRAARFYAHTEPRPALLVLELDGPARQRALARAAAQAARGECTPSARCPESAEQEFVRLRDTAPRLFAVDAGRDAVPLRRRYPDRARYAIAAGEIDLGLAKAESGRPARLRGWVYGLHVTEIHVPFSLRQPFDALAAEERRRRGSLHDEPSPFRATVAWGQRLEPWLVDLAPLSRNSTAVPFVQVRPRGRKLFKKPIRRGRFIHPGAPRA
jgi:hypothetical protein